MTKEMKSLIESNYIELFNKYCRYKDKNQLNNSYSCEDIFNDKILYFIENYNEPTLEILKEFIRTKRKAIPTIKTLRYFDCYLHNEEEETLEDKLSQLFIDYRKK